MNGRRFGFLVSDHFHEKTVEWMGFPANAKAKADAEVKAKAKAKAKAGPSTPFATLRSLRMTELWGAQDDNINESDYGSRAVTSLNYDFQCDKNTILRFASLCDLSFGSKRGCAVHGSCGCKRQEAEEARAASEAVGRSEGRSPACHHNLCRA